ncbi:hypothetical protein P692DRAFT_20839154 [Suillus brevipes Sb2]|nr:hypothetical protein P692DRAFT_20839154 [Suillus brevipes Sb2]
MADGRDSLPKQRDDDPWHVLVPTLFIVDLPSRRSLIHVWLTNRIKIFTGGRGVPQQVLLKLIIKTAQRELK